MLKVRIRQSEDCDILLGPNSEPPARCIRLAVYYSTVVCARVVCRVSESVYSLAERQTVLNHCTEMNSPEAMIEEGEREEAEQLSRAC
jgi:hypothetical protein